MLFRGRRVESRENENFSFLTSKNKGHKVPFINKLDSKDFFMFSKNVQLGMCMSNGIIEKEKKFFSGGRVEKIMNMKHIFWQRSRTWKISRCLNIKIAGIPIKLAFLRFRRCRLR
jgi:hypothetical protein